MEIEESKSAGERQFKKLILPKPSKEAKKLIINGKEYSFKDFLSGKQSLSYRCINRNLCNACIHVPLTNYDQYLKLINPSQVNSITFLKEHSRECDLLSQNQKNIANASFEVELFERNINVLQKYVRDHPLEEPKQVRAEMIKLKQNFSRDQIVRVIQDVRNELFPRDKEKVFTPTYCAALDSKEQCYNMFKAYVRVPYFQTRGQCLASMQEFVILVNNPMLKNLSNCNQWFIDATFKVAPKGFKQILNILVFIPQLQIFYPSCFILMTHKSQNLYQFVFENLKVISESLKFKLDPKFIMVDFEDALRNALKISFPNIQLGGCYFHFVKALYNRISKLGLKRKQYKAKAKTLLSYFQILIHCSKENREEFFKEIKELFFNEDDKFTKFIAYFEKRWLKNPFLDNLFESLQKPDDIEFIRSNNPCEVFHNFLGKFRIFIN